MISVKKWNNGTSILLGYKYIWDANLLYFIVLLIRLFFLLICRFMWCCIANIRLNLIVINFNLFYLFIVNLLRLLLLIFYLLNITI